MQTLHLPPSSDTERAARARLRRERASVDHYDTLITEPTVGYEDGDDRPVFVYAPVPRTPADTALVDALVADPRVWHLGPRTDGMMARARIFGGRPRFVLQQVEWCDRASFDRDYPDLADQVAARADSMADAIGEWRPDVLDAQRANVARVRPEYRINDVFTSGIINYVNALAYHCDGGNFTGSWNAQLSYRSHTEGGHLVVPRWRVAFACDDAMMLLMDSQGSTHGVTPMVKHRRDGYRISVVYYAMKALCVCGSRADELAHVQRKRTEREQRRAGIIQ